MAIENNIYLDSISQFANDNSIVLESIRNQRICDNYTIIDVEKSVKWLSNSWVPDNNHQIDCVDISVNMVNIESHTIKEISWLVAQSKTLDSNYLNCPCYEGSIAGQAAFIMESNIKNNDVNTIMSQVWSQCKIRDIHGKYNQVNYTKSPSICLCNSQYMYGHNTNIKICCTQQSAHGCQVSNSSLDGMRSMPFLSGSFLKSSANSFTSDNYNSCTGGCRDYVNCNILDTCWFAKHSTLCSKEKQGCSADEASDSYLKNFNGSITPESLAACHSHDSQYLYSKQETFFSDKGSFNCYDLVFSINPF